MDQVQKIIIRQDMGDEIVNFEAYIHNETTIIIPNVKKGDMTYIFDSTEDYFAEYTIDDIPYVSKLYPEGYGEYEPCTVLFRLLTTSNGKDFV